MQRICDLSIGVRVQVCCRNLQNEVFWRYIFTDFASVEKLKLKDKEEGDCGRYAKIQRETGQDRSRERDERAEMKVGEGREAERGREENRIR